jgi:hypothetical protein
MINNQGGNKSSSSLLHIAPFLWNSIFEYYYSDQAPYCNAALIILFEHCNQFLVTKSNNCQYVSIYRQETKLKNIYSWTEGVLNTIINITGYV